MATFPVTANGDDGEVWSTTFDASSTDQQFGNQSGTSFYSWVRFTSVAVPNSATIDSATITFTAAFAGASTTCSATIYGIDEDDSAAPTNKATWDTDHAAHTTASAAWTNVGAWTQGATTNAITPSLVTIVQEIVDRPGWATGNAMQFHIDDNSSSANAFRRWASYEHATIDPPLLTITFTPAVTAHGQASVMVVGSALHTGG